jgi:hypothetical protein
MLLHSLTILTQSDFTPTSDSGYSENDYNYGQIKHLAIQRIGKLKTEKRNSGPMSSQLTILAVSLFGLEFTNSLTS